MLISNSKKWSDDLGQKLEKTCRQSRHACANFQACCAIFCQWIRKSCFFAFFLWKLTWNMDKKAPSKFKGWSNMFFSNYAQGPIKVSPNVLVWSGSPAVQNFNKLRIMHCHQDSKMMLSYVSESVHFDIVDNYCYYCRLTLFSDNICCCCYHHPRCIVWQLARAIRCKFCFWQPIFCAPLFHVIKLTIKKLQCICCS